MPKIISTPCYVIDERKLLRNMKTIGRVRKLSGARVVLALKCFASWSVFDLMKPYMDGTTSSSLYEAKLGAEKFGGETHAYCVGWSDDDIAQVKKYADKIIFNSVSQLDRFGPRVKPIKTGLRVNPGISYSHFDLADPARRYSRLGVAVKKDLQKALPKISGVMFHFNCENSDYASFASLLANIGKTYGSMLLQLDWVSLGGGLFFTSTGYPVDRFCDLLRSFSERYGIQVYLEPGESAITRCAELHTSVVDIVHNEIDIAIVDASTEAHMLDLLIYRTPAKIDCGDSGKYTYMVAGRSCLAGDIFGTYRFPSKLKVGSRIKIADAAGYSLVKKNWFNGLQMPSIAIRRATGKIEVIRRFGYHDFINCLS